MDCGGRGRGGGDLDYLLPHASILQERGGTGSVVTSVESKDEMAALNVDIMRINQNYGKEVIGPAKQGDSGNNPNQMLGPLYHNVRRIV